MRFSVRPLRWHLGKTTIPRTRVDTAHLLPGSSASYLRQSNAGHQRILDAISQRDANAARAAMRQHLTFSSDRLKRLGSMSNKPASVVATSSGESGAAASPRGPHTQ